MILFRKFIALARGHHHDSCLHKDPIAGWQAKASRKRRGFGGAAVGEGQPRRARLPEAVEDPAHPILVKAMRQLVECFGRERKAFTLAFAEFHLPVWQVLLAIPYGETRTYGGIARQIGASTAMRAVGAANGRNPIAIIALCHRVIGASG